MICKNLRGRDWHTVKGDKYAMEQRTWCAAYGVLQDLELNIWSGIYIYIYIYLFLFSMDPVSGHKANKHPRS